MGETLGVWGLGPGPYLVLPFLAPLTVRDGLGRAVDSVLDPLWLVPFFGGTALNLVNTVNERSLHLRLFAGVEDSTLDLYSAVRNGYLQRRRRAIASRQRSVAGAPVSIAAVGGSGG
jgi:phospholipid-binding lipoprotein MlaA